MIIKSKQSDAYNRSAKPPTAHLYKSITYAVCARCVICYRLHLHNWYSKDTHAVIGPIISRALTLFRLYILTCDLFDPLGPETPAVMEAVSLSLKTLTNPFLML